MLVHMYVGCMLQLPADKWVDMDVNLIRRAPGGLPSECLPAPCTFLLLPSGCYLRNMDSDLEKFTSGNRGGISGWEQIL